MELNKGLISTNDNCIGCNRCIAVCPVAGANVARQRDGKGYIKINDDNCVHCGVCLGACRHGARAAKDDTQRFLQDLQQGERISVLVDPSFFIVCADRAEQILGYLQELGVHMFYDGGYGADIATWAYLSYLQEHPTSGAILPTCAAMVNYIRKYSKPLMEKLIPMKAPFLCLAQYVRKYLHNTDKLAYLGNCSAKSYEVSDSSNAGLVQYNVTMRTLWKMIRLKDLSGYSATVQLQDCGLGSMHAVSGGVAESIMHFAGNVNIREVHGSRRANHYLKEAEKRIRENKPLPFCVDIMNCDNGCVSSMADVMFGGINDDIIFRAHQRREKNFMNIDDEKNPYLQELSLEERRRRLQERFAHLKLEDFYNGGERDDIYVGQKPVYKARLDTIFRSMHKEMPATRMIDCRSCGYNSCLEMATAIARGYNTIENCVCYLKDENARLSMLDIRSGIPNMNAFFKNVEQLIAEGTLQEYTTMLFSLTNFWFINQEYGFQRGDDALREYCRTISRLIGENEMIAMLGDNNFVGMVHPEHLDKILKVLEHTPLHTLGAEKLGENFCVSAQVALYVPDGTDDTPSMVLDKLSATLSLLNKTPNCFTLNFDERFLQSAEEEAKILQAIEPAIASREFEPFFQPKVDMRSRSLVGAEALIRWRRDGALVSPGKFIPIAEKTGLVKKLDFYILEETCRYLRKWQEQGIDLVPISVNFSKHHFEESAIADKIYEVLKRHGVSSEYIEVEFTETAYLGDSRNLILSIDRLHEYGISSSMDDFGAGYSSLSMLQNMSFDTLKLDRSFLTSGNYEEERCRTVISHIVRMAKDLKMSIVSEGIETERELAYMAELGCDVAQGYLFDRPLPAGEFEERLWQKNYPEHA